MRPFLSVLRGYLQALQAITQPALRATVALTGDKDLGLRTARSIEAGDFDEAAGFRMEVRELVLRSNGARGH